MKPQTDKEAHSQSTTVTAEFAGGAKAKGLSTRVRTRGAGATATVATAAVPTGRLRVIELSSSLQKRFLLATGYEKDKRM